MPNEITLKQAHDIIAATKNLASCRDILKKIDAGISVEITIFWDTGKRNYSSPVTEKIQHKAECANSQVARSVIVGIRREWAAKEAAAIRTLRQLGAEVPNG